LMDSSGVNVDRKIGSDVRRIPLADVKTAFDGWWTKPTPEKLDTYFTKYGKLYPEQYEVTKTNWYSKTPVTTSVDRSTGIGTVTIDKKGMIVMVYGYGGIKTPHNIVFKETELTRACFVGCYPGVTNNTIPDANRLHSAPMSTTDKLVWSPADQTSPQNCNKWRDDFVKEAIELAQQWLKDNPDLTEVTIYTKNLVKHGQPKNDWREFFPGEMSIIVTRK